MKATLEKRQIAIYFYAVLVAIAVAAFAPPIAALERSINPTLGFMLFVTFLQIPLKELKRAFLQGRFFVALLMVNFVVVPLLVAVLVQFLPDDPMVRFGVLLVLLTPCIDYVVTFAQLGRADARLLLAATPFLLILQMLLLPLYLALMLGESVVGLVQPKPFIHAFVWLIAVPLALAALVQFWAARAQLGERTLDILGWLPVPATALVLFVVVAAVAPQLKLAIEPALQALPAYIAFAAVAPLIGWRMGKLFGLDDGASRSLAFSGATRNSLVVLPLALAVPGAMPVLPAIIVAQTLVELLSELVYVRVIARLRHRVAVPQA